VHGKANGVELTTSQRFGVATHTVKRCADARLLRPFDKLPPCWL